jgi:hypothetical protein
MIEATMCILLLAGLFLASAEVVRMAGLSRAVGDERARGLAIAQDLLQEISLMPLGTDPVLAPAELSPASRAAYTTVYDYSNLNDAPPRSRDGAAIPGYSGWSRRVTVRTLNPTTLEPSLVPGTGVAQVTVEAFRGQRLAARLTLIRTASWDAVRFDPRTNQGPLMFTTPPPGTPPASP